MLMLHKAVVFVKRDFAVDTSYRFAFFFEFLIAVVPVFSFYFIGKLVGGQAATALDRYGVDYFAFALVGVAMTQYFSIALSAFTDTMRRSQMAGCLEAMLSTRTSPQEVVLYSSLYTFGIKTLHIALIFLIGALIFGVRYGQANLPAILVTLLLTIAAFSGFGILSAATLILFKRGDPVAWVVGTVSALLGGAYFPVSVLPAWLRPVTVCIPVTHALEAMRLAIFRGYTIPMLWRSLAILAGLAVVILPLGLWIFGLAVEKGRRDGTLLHY